MAQLDKETRRPFAAVLRSGNERGLENLVKGIAGNRDLVVAFKTFNEFNWMRSQDFPSHMTRHFNQLLNDVLEGKIKPDATAVAEIKEQRKESRATTTVVQEVKKDPGSQQRPVIEPKKEVKIPVQSKVTPRKDTKQSSEYARA